MGAIKSFAGIDVLDLGIGGGGGEWESGGNPCQIKLFISTGDDDDNNGRRRHE